MVLHKREECVLNAFRAAEFPPESKPIRKKRSNLRKSIEARRVDSMELLATVAEMMLLERGKTAENLIASVSKDFGKIDKPLDKGKTIKVEQCYQENYNEGILVGNSHGQTSSGDSVISGSSVAKSDVGKRRSGKTEEKNAMPPSIKVENSMLDHSIRKTGASSIMEDPMELERNQSSSFSSDSSVGTGTSSCRDPAPSCIRSSPTSKEDVKLKDQHGDEDENSSGCTHSGPIRPEPFSTEQAGERRNGINMDSKIRKVARTVSKAEDLLIRDVDVRFRSRKVCCKRQRTQRSSFRRKKPHERNNPMSSAAAKAGENAVKVEGSSTPAALHGGVKIRIKSFRIPELFIDMPENATVGSLKRTVLETVTAMLGDGLEVGLILQGRKVRDDSRTLAQTGIACREKLDSLSFSLEPTPLALCPELPTYESPQPLATLPALPASDSAAISSKPDTNESSPVPLDDGGNDTPTNSSPKFKALVPLSPGASESMTLVPQSGKPRRTEVAQRRIRRPFSVAEVEALVKAVESLGTGRWRDVKLLAFDEAKHRTYVDLKDKWKTLVHTAQISPQQRRGEPVPQMLLDRVLRTHAYWTRHGQSKPPPVSSTAHHHPKQEQSALQLIYQGMTTEDSTLPPPSSP